MPTSAAVGLIVCLANAGLAQSLPNQPQPDIVVIGTRDKADVDVESSLDETEIEGFGTDSIAQLIKRIGPLIGGTVDQPVLIVNGKIIADPKEIEGYPPEALNRVEVLTRDAAGKYGFPSEKRVVNLVLKSRFKNYVVGVEARTLAELDGDAESLTVQRAAIHGNDRWSADATFSRASSLLHSDRNLPSPTNVSTAGSLFGIDGQELDPALSALANTPVLSAAVPASAGTRPFTINDLLAGANRPGAGDDGHFRTVSPATRAASLNLSFSKDLGETSVTATLHGSTQQSSQQIGLASTTLDLPAGSAFLPLANDARLNRLLTSGPLASNSRQTSAGFSAALASRIMGMSAVANLSYERSDAITRTDDGFDLSSFQARIRANDPTINPFGILPLGAPMRDRTTSSSETWSAALDLRDTVKLLPAGPIFWTVGATYRLARSNADSIAAFGPVTESKTVTGQSDLRLGISAPLTNGSPGLLHVLGRTSFNMSAVLSAASQSSQRASVSGGFSWTPVKGVSLTGLASFQNSPPSDEQRYAPVLSTPNVRIFDYRSGELVDVTEITGGNPRLEGGKTKRLALGLSGRPFGSKGPLLNFDYASRISTDGIGSLPPLSEIVEAVLPDRVHRSPNGQLTVIDMRPVNYARDTQKTLRMGVSWRLVLPKSTLEVRREAGDPTRWKGNRSIQLAVTHDWEMASSLLIRAGLPELDRLQGRGGGEGRHKLRAQFNLVLRGLGVTFDTTWQGPYRQLAGIDGPNPNDLRFGAILKTTLELDLYPFSFDFLGRLAVMKDARVSITIDNLLDDRRSVTRLDGTEPRGYSKNDLDPFGRTFKVSLRRRL